MRFAPSPDEGAKSKSRPQTHSVHALLVLQSQPAAASGRSTRIFQITSGANMAQITLYIDDALQARLLESSARLKVSQSQFVADLIRQAVASHWPDEFLALAGSISDFPTADGLRAGQARRRTACLVTHYALDTNIISYFMRGEAKAAQRLTATPPDKVAVPAVVV